MPSNPRVKTETPPPERSEPASDAGWRPSKRVLAITGGVVAGIIVLMVVVKLVMMRSGRHLEPRDGLVCLLVNKNSGRCLSVAGEDTKAGAKIVQGPTPDRAKASERWILLKADGGFRLQNEHSQMVLEIPGRNTTKGVPAIQWYDGMSSPNQHWEFEEVGKGYVLRVRHSQYVLAIGQGSKDEGAAAVQWEFVPDVNDQVWQLHSALPQ